MSHFSRSVCHCGNLSVFDMHALPGVEVDAAQQAKVMARTCTSSIVRRGIRLECSSLAWAVTPSRPGMSR